MWIYATTIVLIFIVLFGGIAVDRLYRAFAARHPRLGPFRKAGCGSCGCHGDACDGPTH